MTWLSFLELASALVLAQGGPSANHAWIADIKAKRASLGGKDVRVEGLVVDIRSTASESRRGLYRLIDESDSEGVLIRTTRLPTDGGTYRVRTQLAARQPADGSLLLEELNRDRTDSRSPVPLAIALLSGLAFVVLGLLAFRAARAERRFLVSPPLWLLPEAGPHGKTAPAGEAPAPSLSYDPDLEEADRREREQLKARRRTLLRSLAIAVVCLLGSGAWLLAIRPSTAAVPAFILIDANDNVPFPPAPPTIIDTVFADRPVEQRFDSLLRPPPARRDTAGPRRIPATVAVTPPRRSDPVAADTKTPVTAPAPAPAPPAPAPLPAPAPPPPSPLPASPPPAPLPSPEENRRLATDALAEGINRLVAAVNGKRVTELLILVPEEMAGDAGRLERFVDLVKGFAPRATLGTVEQVSLAEDRGEARFAVAFAWRGDFGVERRKTGRFVGVVSRQDGRWRFQGARLLDAVP